METNDVEPSVVKAVMSSIYEVGKLLRLTRWQMTRVLSNNAGVPVPCGNVLLELDHPGTAIPH